MRKNWLLLSLLSLLSIVCLAGLSGCLTNVPDPELGGVYACVAQEDCPGTQSCLQQTCEAIELPNVQILSPEDGQPFTFGEPHNLILSISATNLVLRPLAESNEAVPGEGHLVVFVDEQPPLTVDTGDLSGGVQMEISVEDIPGVHRLRVQARLNDGTNYDNETADARNLIWVDDGREHVALRKPWPGDTFTLDSQLIDAEVAVMDDSGITIGPPNTGVQHVHVFYDETLQSFPACIADSLCFQAYEGIVPSNDDTFGPVLLPAAGAGPVSLVAVIMDFEHFIYLENGTDPIYSSIDILRSND
jgi:hypothetical protein